MIKVIHIDVNESLMIRCISNVTDTTEGVTKRRASQHRQTSGGPREWKRVGTRQGQVDGKRKGYRREVEWMMEMELVERGCKIGSDYIGGNGVRSDRVGCCLLLAASSPI